MHRLIFLGLTVFCLACTTSKNTSMTKVKTSDSKGSSELSLDFDVSKKTLKNGLTTLLVENKKLPIVTVYVYYRVGGKFERLGTTGSSHLLEHMMFKGAKKYGAGEFDKVVEGNGGRNNAYTTHDSTVYYESLPSDHLSTIIDLEADRMQNLLLEPVSFDKERDVVLEERKMRYENSDRGKLFLKMMKETFKGTPYGNSVIGEVQDLKTIPREKVLEYFKTYYAPNNAILVIVGDFDKDDVMEEVEKKFGPIPPSKNLEKIKKEHAKNQGGFDFKGRFNREFHIHGQSKNPNFILAYKGVKITKREGFVLDILSSILGGGESSYLHQEFVVGKKPSLSKVYASNYTLQDSGVFFIGGELLQKKSLRQTKSKILNSLKKSCEKAVTSRSLQKIKNQYLSETLLSLDTNASVASYLGDREFYFNDYSHYKKEMAIYNSITVDEVKKACKSYLQKSKSNFFTVWNKHRSKQRAKFRAKDNIKNRKRN